MRTFEIDQGFQELIRVMDLVDDELIDDDTREKATAELLKIEDGLLGNLGDKIDGWDRVIKTFEAQETAIRKEVKRLTGKARAFSNRSERMKERLFDQMNLLGIRKVAGEFADMRIQKAGGLQPVSITDDALIDNAYRRPGPPDKKLIRQAILDGNVVPGAELLQRKDYLRIR